MVRFHVLANYKLVKPFSSLALAIMRNSDLRSICVGSNGVDLTYWDSGVPSCSKDYVTIIALHGLGFSGGTWYGNRELQL